MAQPSGPREPDARIPWSPPPGTSGAASPRAVPTWLSEPLSAVGVVRPGVFGEEQWGSRCRAVRLGHGPRVPRSMTMNDSPLAARPNVLAARDADNVRSIHEDGVGVASSLMQRDLQATTSKGIV